MTAVRAAAAAAVTGFQVGSAMVATRFVVHDVGPASLALLRYLIGFCCLLPWLLPALHGFRLARRDLLPIALLGTAQFGILIALLNYGLQYISSARAALIFATFPLLTMVLAAVLGRERLTPIKTCGVVLSILGVGFALGESAVLRGTAPDQWIGELAVLASAFTGALCSVLYRPYLQRYPTLPLCALAMLFSLGFLAILAAGEGFFATRPHFTLAAWLAILYIGIGSGVGYFLWLWALNHASPTRVTVFLALSPVTAAGLGTVLLSESVTRLFLVGLLCVALGLWLANWRTGNGRRVEDRATTM